MSYRAWAFQKPKVGPSGVPLLLAGTHSVPFQSWALSRLRHSDMVAFQPGSCAKGTTDALLVSTLHHVLPIVSTFRGMDRKTDLKGKEHARGRMDIIVRPIRVVSNIVDELDRARMSFVIRDSYFLRWP